MAIAKVVEKAKYLSQRRPLLFNSVMYGSFYTAAELTRQSYTQIFKVSVPNQPARTIDIEKPSFPRLSTFLEALGLVEQESGTEVGQYNWPQIKRYAIYGCFFAGPVLHGWYKWLDGYFRGTAVRVVGVKLLADQFILTPPLVMVFFISMSLMEGKSDIFSECKAKFIPTFKTSCMYWIPMQFVNFMLVPSAFRVMFVSVAAFCWVNILCYFKSVPLSDENNDKDKR